MMRRGQIEIVGLLIIVMIISFLLLFFVSQTTSSEPEDFSSQMERSIGQGWIYAMLETDSECHEDKNMKELIDDCSMRKTMGTDFHCDDGRTSCEYLRSELVDLLNSTVLEWQRPYTFYITYPDSRHSYIVNATAGNHSLFSGCEPVNQPIPTVGGTTRVALGMGDCEHLIEN